MLDMKMPIIYEPTLWDLLIFLIQFLVCFVIFLYSLISLNAYPRWKLHYKYDVYIGKANFFNYVTVIERSCWDEDYHCERPDNIRTDFISTFGMYPKHKEGVTIASMSLRWKIICAYLIKSGIESDCLYIIHDYLGDEIY